MAGIVSGWPAVKIRILRNGSAVYLSKGISEAPHIVGTEAACSIRSGEVCKLVDVLGVDPVGSLPVVSVNRLATWCRGPRWVNYDSHE